MDLNIQLLVYNIIYMPAPCNACSTVYNCTRFTTLYIDLTMNIQTLFSQISLLIIYSLSFCIDPIWC